MPAQPVINRLVDLYDVPTLADGQVPVRQGSGFTATDIATQVELNAAVAAVQAHDPRIGWLGRIINRTLVAGIDSFGLAILSDSTANDTTDWFYLEAAAIAARHPAYTVRWYLWSDATQDYAAPVTIQTGTAGARYITFAGSGFNWQLPVALASSTPTDLDVSVDLALDDWTPTTSQVIVGRENGAGARGWWLDIQTNGKIELVWTADGTNLLTAQSSVAPTVVDGARLFIRAKLDVDDGAGHYTVKFYTSTDGATWTQLGTTITGGATTSVFNPAGIAYSLGGRGTSVLMSGKVYEVRIRSGLDGNTILPCFPEAWEPFSSGSPNLGGPSGAPVLAIVGGAQPGQGITYLSDATRLPKMLPHYSIRAVFLSTSHNDGNTISSPPGYDAGYLATWTAWIAAVKARAPEAQPVGVTQNPETTGSSSSPQGIRAHGLRRNRLLTLWSQLGVVALDAWQVFLDSGGNLLSSLLTSDGIHPTATGPGDGMHAWAAYADAALGAP